MIIFVLQSSKIMLICKIMCHFAVQLLTEEYSTMSPGELEAKGFLPHTDQPDQGSFQGKTKSCTYTTVVYSPHSPCIKKMEHFQLVNCNLVNLKVNLVCRTAICWGQKTWIPWTLLPLEALTVCISICLMYWKLFFCITYDIVQEWWWRWGRKQRQLLGDRRVPPAQKPAPEEDPLPTHPLPPTSRCRTPTGVWPWILPSYSSPVFMLGALTQILINFVWTS